MGKAPRAAEGGRSGAPRRWAWAPLLVGTVVLAACQWGINYVDPEGPRWAGPLPGPPPAARWRDTLTVVSFNIREGLEVDSALAVLTHTPSLPAPDVLLLQEMDAEGVRRIAEALAMAWVYYPANRRGNTHRDFGNAVLSRWPIAADAKVLLPYRSIVGRTQRIAVAATVQVGGVPVRVYSVHLATGLNQARRDRAEQFLTVLRDAAPYPHVVVGGDLNDDDFPELAVERGFSWPTRQGPGTTVFGRLDHILFKGLQPPAERAAGTVTDNRGASDHKPVWARGVLR